MKTRILGALAASAIAATTIAIAAPAHAAGEMTLTCPTTAAAGATVTCTASGTFQLGSVILIDDTTSTQLGSTVPVSNPIPATLAFTFSMPDRDTTIHADNLDGSSSIVGDSAPVSISKDRTPQDRPAPVRLSVLAHSGTCPKDWGMSWAYWANATVCNAVTRYLDYGVWDRGSWQRLNNTALAWDIGMLPGYTSEQQPNAQDAINTGRVVWQQVNGQWVIIEGDIASMPPTAILQAAVSDSSTPEAQAVMSKAQEFANIFHARVSPTFSLVGAVAGLPAAAKIIALW